MRKETSGKGAIGMVKKVKKEEVPEPDDFGPEEFKLLLEGVFLLFAWMGASFVIPALISAHDSIALIGAFFLGLALFAWAAGFLHRVIEKSKGV
jgi:hypothetical protein